MPRELDPRMADRLARNAMSFLSLTPGHKVLATKALLEEAFMFVAREAHEIGYLAGHQARYGEVVRPRSPERPAWMDIRLDAPEELARHHIRLMPVVIRSLIGAGYHCLGDLRWISAVELRDLHYVGIKTAWAIRAIVNGFERMEEALTELDARV